MRLHQVVESSLDVMRRLPFHPTLTHTLYKAGRPAAPVHLYFPDLCVLPPSPFSRLFLPQNTDQVCQGPRQAVPRSPRVPVSAQRGSNPHPPEAHTGLHGCGSGAEDGCAVGLPEEPPDSQDHRVPVNLQAGVHLCG